MSAQEPTPQNPEPHQQQPQQQDQQREKFRELLEEFRTAMLITHAPDGTLRARPMAIAQVEPDCGLWFLTGHDTAKAHEIEQDTRAHVACQNDRSAYLSISGTASLVRDRAKLDELWSEPYRAWFPGGKDDPNIALIHFKAAAGEYWDNEGTNKAKFILETVKAYMSGERTHVREGEQHGKIGDWA